MMSLMRWQPVTVLTVFFAFVPTAPGQQQNTPRIGYVYPAGGRQGTTFRVTLGGQYLNGVTKAYVSGTGVQAAVIEHDRPLTQRQINELREKMRQLQEKRSAAMKARNNRRGQSEAPPSDDAGQEVTWTAEDEQMLVELRQKLLEAPKRLANPALAENVILEITMAADAGPGRRELRLLTTAGLTNPLVFCVGQLPEFMEEKAGSTGQQGRRDAKESAADQEMRITLPGVVNGQILPGEVDRFRFAAHKGERLVAAVSARALIPYLADAVPGWFQATLALYDADGKELAYADDYRFNPDPVLYCEIPADGDYIVELKDSIYRGREDFVYRLALGELPFVTSIFPLGGQAGARTSVELRGWNLPTDRLTPDTAGDEPATCSISVRKGRQVSNSVPFAVDTLPECLERESNDSYAGAQAIELPLIVNGRIERPGDSDVFCFEGRAGSEIVAEVYARRLNSPLDSVLRVSDAIGRQLAANDDCEDKGAGLATHHADSHLCLTLPADGTYYLHLSDAQNKGGTAYGYRLRVSPPRPDFELRVVPSSLNTRAGATVPVTVYALRKDGFNDDIRLALKDAPAGFTLSGGWVPAHQDQVVVTLTVPPTPTEEPVTLLLEGRAVVQGREIVRPVVPADDMMQAFFYRHLVPAREFEVVVGGRGGFRGPVSVVGETPVRIPAGGTARVQIVAPGNRLAAQVRLELSEPPEGITIQKVISSREGAEIVLQSDASQARPGLKGNLIVNVLRAGSQASGGGRAQTNRRLPSLGALPAIPFEIVEPHE